MQTPHAWTTGLGRSNFQSASGILDEGRGLGQSLVPVGGVCDLQALCSSNFLSSQPLDSGLPVPLYSHSW